MLNRPLRDYTTRCGICQIVATLTISYQCQRQHGWRQKWIRWMKRLPARTENYGVGGLILPLGTNNIKDLSQNRHTPETAQRCVSGVQRLARCSTKLAQRIACGGETARLSVKPTKEADEVRCEMSEYDKLRLQAIGYGALMVVGFAMFLFMLVTGLPFEPHHYLKGTHKGEEKQNP